MEPVLQVALDMMQLKRSIGIAAEAVEGGADWVEVGTPLIKSEGAEAVRTVKKAFPGHKIIADTKTMDTGAFEVEIMAKAGADIVTVLGLADDATISEAVLCGRKYGAEIMVDMINVPDKVARAKQIEKLGVAYICLHMGIDSQMRGEDAPVEILKKIVAEVSVPVAVAGGITSETVKDYVEAGAYDIIVGGGITKTDDIRKAAADIKKAMKGLKVDQTIAKKYTEDDLFEAFSKVSTCNISDAFHKQGVIFGLHPYIKHGTRMVGRALTVQTLAAEASALMGDRLDMKVQLGVRCETRDRLDVSLVTDVTEGAPLERRPGIVIVWPEPGEDAWTIARRYAIPAAQTAGVTAGKAMVLKV